MLSVFNPLFANHPILGLVVFAIALVVIAACIVFFVIMMAKKEKTAGGQKPTRKGKREARKAARKEKREARKARKARKAKKTKKTPDTPTDTPATPAEDSSVLKSCRTKFAELSDSVKEATAAASEAREKADAATDKADEALTEANKANSRLDAQEAVKIEAALQPQIDSLFFALTDLLGAMLRNVADAALRVKRDFPAAPEVGTACNAFKAAKQALVAAAAAAAVEGVEQTHRGCVGSTTPDTPATANAMSPKDVANTRFQKLVRELQKLLKELKAARDSTDPLRDDVETFNPEVVKAAAKAQTEELNKLLDEVEAIKQQLPKGSKAADDLTGLVTQIKEVPLHFITDLAMKYEALKASYDSAIAEVEETLKPKA